MSTLRLDNWDGLSNGSSVTSIVQIQNYSFNLVSAYEGSYVSLGPISSYNSPPPGNNNFGYEVAIFDFRPKYVDSTILLETSMLTVYEASNISDDFRLYAINLDDSNLLTWTRASSPYDSFASARNSARFSLRGTFSSWGTTQKRIQIRMDTSGSTSASYGFNARYAQSQAIAPFYVTIQEFR